MTTNGRGNKFQLSLALVLCCNALIAPTALLEKANFDLKQLRNIPLKVKMQTLPCNLPVLQFFWLQNSLVSDKGENKAIFGGLEKSSKFWFSWPVQKLMGFHKTIWEGDKNPMCVCVCAFWYGSPLKYPVTYGCARIIRWNRNDNRNGLHFWLEMLFERRQMPTQNTNGVTTKNVAFNTVNTFLGKKYTPLHNTILV